MLQTSLGYRAGETRDTLATCAKRARRGRVHATSVSNTAESATLARPHPGLPAEAHRPVGPERRAAARPECVAQPGARRVGSKGPGQRAVALRRPRFQQAAPQRGGAPLGHVLVQSLSCRPVPGAGAGAGRRGAGPEQDQHWDRKQGAGAGARARARASASARARARARAWAWGLGLELGLGLGLGPGPGPGPGLGPGPGSGLGLGLGPVLGPGPGAIPRLKSIVAPIAQAERPPT